MGKALCVGNAALEPSKLGAGADKVQKVNMIVIHHPLDLALVAVEGLQLLLNLVGDVYILVRQEVDASQVVHVIDGNDAGGLGRAAQVGGNGEDRRSTPSVFSVVSQGQLVEKLASNTILLTSW